MSRSQGRLGAALRNLKALLSKSEHLQLAYQAPFEVVYQDRRVSLRHYSSELGPRAGSRPVLLVPPLMVTAEVYDISPELSVVERLRALNYDTYLADFGAPEEALDGFTRTLDDHVTAVSACLEFIQRKSGQDTHLIGYSQGGMFCYQVAAYRVAAGKPSYIASLVTFGAPVDSHRNVPLKVHEALVSRSVSSLRKIVDKPLSSLRSLPSAITSLGFKLLSPGQEIRQFAKVIGQLHDEDALKSLLPKRRFLSGDGFIAWSGPAFRKFVDDFVVFNRMKQGGFVIQNHTISLADIEAPILAFYGSEDDFAQPEAVKGIQEAAIHADITLQEVPAGHFGLVVGTVAMRDSWPATFAWLLWRDGLSRSTERLERLMPRSLSAEAIRPEPAFWQHLWRTLGEIGVELSTSLTDMARDIPRVWRLNRLEGSARLSPALRLQEVSHSKGEAIAFVWQGRAYSLAEAQAYVTDLAYVLAAFGVKPGSKVVLEVQNPLFALSLTLACSRLGALAQHGSNSSQETQVQEYNDECWLKDKCEERFKLSTLLAEAKPNALYRELASTGGLDAGLGAEEALRLVCNGRDLTLTNLDLKRSGLLFAITAELTWGDTLYCGLETRSRALYALALAGILESGGRLALAKPGEDLMALRRVGANLALLTEADAVRLSEEQESWQGAPLRLVLVEGASETSLLRLREHLPPKLKVIRVESFFSNYIA